MVRLTPRGSKPAAACAAAVALSLTTAARGADAASAPNVPRAPKDKKNEDVFVRFQQKVSVDTASATLFAHVHPIQSVQNAWYGGSPTMPVHLAGSILAGGVLMQQAIAHKEMFEGFLGKKKGNQPREANPAAHEAHPAEASHSRSHTDAEHAHHQEVHVKRGPWEHAPPPPATTSLPWRLLLPVLLVAAAVVGALVRRCRSSAKGYAAVPYPAGGKVRAGGHQRSRSILVAPAADAVSREANFPNGPSLTPTRTPPNHTPRHAQLSDEALGVAAQKAQERSKSGSYVWQNVSKIETKLEGVERRELDDECFLATSPRSFSRKTTGSMAAPNSARCSAEFHRLMTESSDMPQQRSAAGTADVAGIESLYGSLSCEFHRIITPPTQAAGGLVRQRTEEIEKKLPDAPGQRTESQGCDFFWRSETEANDLNSKQAEDLDAFRKELQSSTLVGS